jgi:phage gp36-like protein
MAFKYLDSPTDVLTVLTPKQQQELTDVNVGGDIVVDLEVIREILEFAEDFCDSYINNRYVVPLEIPIPKSYRHCILIVGKYHIFLRLNYVTEQTRQEYEDMINWLREIRDGLANLPITDEDELKGGFARGFASTALLTFDETIFRLKENDDG